MSANIEPRAGENRSRFPAISRLYEATLGKVIKTNGGRSAWDFSSYHLLSSDVINELAANKATLGREGIRNLSRNNAYEPTALYLLIKGIEDKETKREIIQQAVVAEAKPQSYVERIRDIVGANVGVLGKEQRVLAGKVYQVSRMGPDLWEERFDQMVKTVATEHKGKEIFVLAHASLVGLQHLSRLSRETREPVHVLIEKWYQNQEDPDSGFTIEAAKGEVSYLRKGFVRPEPGNFVTLDDTVHTWGHFRRAWAYLMDADPCRVVIDPSRALVIDKTSADNSANAPLTG